MAETVELAVGYVSIVPETSKVGPGIEKSLAESAGRIAKFGSVMGTELGKGIAVGVGQGASHAFDEVVDDGAKAGDKAGKGFSEHVVRHSRKAGRDASQGFFQEFQTTSERSGAIIGKILAAPMAANIKAFQGAGHLAARTFQTAFTLGIGSLGLGTALSLGGVLTKGLERQMGLDTANRQLQRMSKQFESVGKQALDYQKIQKMLTNDARTGVLDNTPFALNEAMGAVTLALQGGVDQGKQLTQYMTALTDAAGATQQPFSELAGIFNDIVTKNRLESDEIDQLRNRMIDIPSLLKDAYGWNDDQLQKALKNGQVGIDQVTEAIEKNMGGAAKTAGETLQGAIENVGNAAGRVGAKLIDAFSGKDGDPLGGAKDAVQWVTTELNHLGDWITANKDTIRKWFSTAKDVAGDLLGVLRNIGNFLADSPTLIRNVAIAFGVWEGISVIATIGTTLGNAYNALKGIKTLLTGGSIAKDVADIGAAAARGAGARAATGAGAAVVADAVGGGVGTAAAVAGGSIILPTALIAAGSAAAVGIATMLFNNYVQSAAGKPVEEQLRDALAKLEAERAAKAQRERDNAGLRDLLGAGDGPIIGEGPNFFKDWYPSAKRALWGPDGLLSALNTADLKAKGVTDQMLAVFDAEKSVGAELATLTDDPHTVVLKDNTPEVLDKIDTVQYRIENIDGKFKIVPLTEEAARIIDAFIRAQSDKPITPKVQPDTDVATRVIEAWRKSMGASPVTVPLVAQLQDVLFPGIGGSGTGGGAGGGLPGSLMGGGGQVIAPTTVGGLLGNVAGSGGQGFPTSWNLNAGGMFGGGGNGVNLQPGNWGALDALASGTFGLTMTSGYRPPNGPPAGAAKVPANQSYHASGRAHDFRGSPQEMAAFASYMAKNFGGQLKELIYGGPGWDPAGNIWNGQPHGYGTTTLFDHGLNNPDGAHVHVAFASGGGINGPGTATSDSIPAMLSAGEHVLTAKDVEAMGGQSAVYAFRNALHRAGGGEVQDWNDEALYYDENGDLFQGHPTNWLPTSDKLRQAQKETATGIYSAAADGWHWWGEKPGNFNPNMKIDLSQIAVPWLGGGANGLGATPDQWVGGSGNNRFADGGAVFTPEELAKLGQNAYSAGKDGSPAPTPTMPTEHQGTGTEPGPPQPDAFQQAQQQTVDPQSPDQPKSFLENLMTNVEGFKPSGGGGKAGTSSLAKIVSSGASVASGLIDTGASLANMAVSGAIAAGSFGAGAAGAAQAGSMAAGFGINMAAAEGKRIAQFWLGDLPGIAADALVAQMPLASLFGPPRWAGYDYTTLMPQLGIQEAASTTIQQMGQKAINDYFNPKPQNQVTQNPQPNSPGVPSMASGPAAPVAANPDPNGGPAAATVAPPPPPAPPPMAPITPPQEQVPNLFGFDQGGWLEPGQVGVNMTSRPEPVLTPKQWEALSSVTPKGGDGPTVKIDAIYGMSPEDVAAQIEQKQRLAAMRYSGRP